MSIHIDQVSDYLDTHPICREADTVKSLLEMLHDVYVMHNSMDSEEIREKFREFRLVLNELPKEITDALFSVTCDLCMEHEVLAFSHGVIVGMNLMTDVNRLP